MSSGNGNSLPVTAETPEKTGKRRQRPNKTTPQSPCTPPPKRELNERVRLSPSLTVLVNKVYLFDSGWTTHGSASSNNGEDDSTHSNSIHHPVHHRTSPTVAPYHYEPPLSLTMNPNHRNHQLSHHRGTVEVVVVPCHVDPESQQAIQANNPWMLIPVVDKSIPCPYGKQIIKYWTQRRRLFRLFDHGIELDESGWFSVTPEQIADHVATRLFDLFQQLPLPPQPNQQQPIFILDAFCGCGGNTIAFAKLIPNAIVVAVEVNRSKLLMAAKNASLYGIPSHKIIFCECNALFVLEHCYKNGQFVLDQPLATPEAAMALMNAMPPPVETQVCVGGYQLGGIDILPRSINAVFLDPPWGGVDYNLLGKNGYDLEKNMWIERPTLFTDTKQTGTLQHGFFDTFQNAAPTKAERKAHFNSDMDQSNCVNGTELLMLAAAASDTHFVIYDLPRNINRGSLALAGLAAGYRGNCKLEEHYLNGRLKTVSAYFGSDWSFLVNTNSKAPAESSDKEENT